MPLRFIQFVVSTVCFFLLPSLAWNWCTMVWLSPLFLKDIWVVTNFCDYKWRCYKHPCTYFRVNVSFYFSTVNTQQWDFWSYGVCLTLQKIAKLFLRVVVPFCIVWELQLNCIHQSKLSVFLNFSCSKTCVVAWLFALKNILILCFWRVRSSPSLCPHGNLERMRQTGVCYSAYKRRGILNFQGRSRIKGQNCTMERRGGWGGLREQQGPLQ